MPIFKGKIFPQGVQPPPPSPDLFQQIGPAIAVQIEVPQALAKQLAAQGQTVPQPVTGLALIDTGATISAVDQSAIAHLGVSTVGLAGIGTAGGPQQLNLYPIRIVLTPLGLGIDFSSVTGAPLGGTGFIALLGRDVLARMILIYDGPNGEYTLSY